MAKSKPSRTVTAKNGSLPGPLSAFDVLTLAEAAAYLRLPEEAIRTEAEAGRLVGQHVGGEWRFVRAGVVTWLQSPRVLGKKSATTFPTVEETPEEYEAFMATIQAHRDEIDRATDSGKYAPE